MIYLAPMSDQLHGVITASGNGSRYASSIGATPPYPKHLEKIAGKTVLQWAVEGMAHYLPVSDICVTLHPAFGDLYRAELHRIQEQLPSVPIRAFDIAPIADDGDIASGIVHKVFGPGFFDDANLVAYGSGDVVLNGGDAEGIKSVLRSCLPRISKNRMAVSVIPDVGWWGRIYAIAPGWRMSDHVRSDSHTSLEAFGINWWNINTRGDLLRAENEVQTMQEGRRSQRKEG